MLWRKESTATDALYIDIIHRLRINPESASDRFPTNGDDGKDDQKSIEYREQADAEFEENNFDAAIELYNKSLCYAESKSEHLGLAYAQRAQCFSALKMFDRCLIDIELAKKSNYPRSQLDQLEKRKNICLNLIESGAQVQLFQPKLDFPSHEKYPGMANVLEFDRNDKYGRHLVATADIDVGQLILLEKCFATRTDECYRDCNICMNVQQNLVPCPKCTKALFCHDSCVNNRIHPFECDIYPILESHWEVLSMGLRVFLVGLSLFSNADELINFVEETFTKEDSFQLSTNDAKSQYAFCLQNLKEKFELSEIAQRLENALGDIGPLMYGACIAHNHFNTFFTTEKHRRFLMHLLCHHIILGQLSRIRVDFPVIVQYFNHSCVPNMNTFLVDGYVIGVTFRPIRKGQQVFKCYLDPSQPQMSYDQRQQYLLERYAFQCECERCMVKDIPPPECLEALRADSDFMLLMCFNENPDDSDQNQRKYLTETAKAVLRRHDVVWADGCERPSTLYRNLLIYKFNYLNEY
ncbi:SET and MYND domain-containing protein DDB_G0273589-like [Bradysia coprophila]|uniref:SET and MYND domain-containing protein DDB_G0273589-like n=1 Tax=Bradysia coprophila TaxID=38358 RepID=UPI00187D9D6B|nr:SET and MYND domain-containing protein DDB_G0273589-like [Bradysia coprophila]